jgi:hypothetical protein
MLPLFQSIVCIVVQGSVLKFNLLQMDGREGEKKRLLQETGFSSGTCAVPDEKVNM